MRRIAVLSGLVLVGGLLGRAPPSPGRRTGTARPMPNGSPWRTSSPSSSPTVRRSPATRTRPLDPNDAPPVGTQLFVSEVLYDTEDGETRGDEVGRSHIQCTAQVVELNLLCDGAFVFDNGSQLNASVALDFSMEEGMEPLTSP